MLCGNQPAYISVIIVAAFPSVDGTAAPEEENESQRLIKGKSKVKGHHDQRDHQATTPYVKDGFHESLP